MSKISFYSIHESICERQFLTSNGEKMPSFVRGLVPSFYITKKTFFFGKNSFFLKKVINYSIFKNL